MIEDFDLVLVKTTCHGEIQVTRLSKILLTPKTSFALKSFRVIGRDNDLVPPSWN